MSGFCKSWGFISVLLQIFSRGCSINVALNKQSSYCNKPLTLNKMSDGIKTLTNFERYTEACVTISHVKIDLGGTYAVHYIIVFEGEGNDAGQLDFFSARLSDKICSEYPGRASLVDKSKGLRVNCANRKDVYSNVGIYTLKNIGFTITEIEVHILGQSDEATLIPVGCFVIIDTEGNAFTLESCIIFCTREQFVFVGMKNKQTCGCFNDLNKDDEITITNCDVPCSAKDPQRRCGGSDSFSIYLIASVLPYYEGCLRTSEDLILSAVSRGNMTIAKCLHLCENRRYAYLQSGDHCICQDSINRSMILHDKNVCTKSCTGDVKLACGGDDVASVYATCLSEKMSLPCSKLFNCNDSYDMYGNCDGVCKPRYRGDHCLEKDIDECRYYPCDITTSDCINLNGSYRCQCKSGFIQLTDYACQRNVSTDDEENFEMGYFFFFLIPMLSLLVAVLYLFSAVPLRTESPTVSSYTSGTTADSGWSFR